MSFGISQTGQQKTITRAELVQIILDYEQAKKGANFFSVTQVTKETTKKAPEIRFELSGLKHGKTYFAKATQVNGQFGSNYEDAVNRQRKREGKVEDFVAKPSVLNPVEGSRALQELDGQLYLRYTPITIASAFKPVIVKAINAEVSRPEDFEIVSKEIVSQFKSPTRSYQGLDKAVQIRKISIDSIAAINIAGEEFMIVDLDPTRFSVYMKSGAPRPSDPLEAVA